MVYIVRTRVEPAHDAEWHRWQEQEHATNLVSLPGYRGVQRFADTLQANTYLNIWRLDDRSAQSTDQYRAASLTPWFERIRPHYDVSVEFSREHDGLSAGEAPWRGAVSGLVVDRWPVLPPGRHGAESDRLRDHQATLAVAPGVAHVARLDPLSEDGVPVARAAPSTVLLSYLTPVAAQEFPPTPADVERRSYRALTGYVAAPGRGRD